MKRYTLKKALAIIALGIVLSMTGCKSNENVQINVNSENIIEDEKDLVNNNHTNQVTNEIDNSIVDKEETPPQIEEIKDYYGYKQKNNEDGYYEFEKDGITFVYDESTQTILKIYSEKDVDKIVVPANIGEYKVLTVNNIEPSFSIENELTIEISEGIKNIGKDFLYYDYFEWHTEYPINLILPDSIERIENTLMGANIINMPAAEMFMKYPDYNLNKLSDNVYYVVDYAKDFWNGYEPLDVNDNIEEYKLPEQEINDYLEEAKEYADKNPTKNVVCYICVSDKVYNTADSVVNDFGEAGSPEVTDNYIKDAEQEVVGFEIHMARFTSEDSNIDDFSKAVVYSMRHPETYGGNGGKFDRNEFLIEHEPGSIAIFYDKTVNETGKLLRNYYEVNNKKLIITARLYPGQV